MIHTRDYLDLIHAIHLHPEEDTPRLALADEIDACATTDSDRARAELIRVQVAAALYEVGVTHSLPKSHNPGSCRVGSSHSYDDNYFRLKERERELIAAHSATWRRPPCEACEGRGRVKPKKFTRTGWEWNEGEPCPTCHGTGSTGALSEHWKHTVAWVRGMPVVEVQFGEVGVLENGRWSFRLGWLLWAIRAVKEEGARFKVTGIEPWDSTETQWNWSGVLPGSAVLDRAIGPHRTRELAHAALDSGVTSLVVERACPAAVEVPQ